MPHITFALQINLYVIKFPTPTDLNKQVIFAGSNVKYVT